MSIENTEQVNPQESIKSTIESIGAQVKAISDKLNVDFEVFKNGEKPLDLGISLLNSKPHLLLEYITLLSYYSLLKLTKQSIKDHPLLLKLIKIRAYLEKIKPLETKMKYQIDKLIKAASSADLANVDQSTVDDPYMFKPNPNLLVQDDDEDEDGDAAEEGDGVYKAPRIAPMPYDDNPGYSKEMRSEQRKKEKASRSRMLRDLANQYSEAPEQDKVIGTINLEDDDRELMERETYEEDNFIRLTQSKKQKKKIERLNQRSLHNELLDFDDFHGSGKMSELDLTNKQTSLSRSKRLSRNDSDDEDEGFGGSSGKKRRGGDSLDNLVTDGFRSSVKDGKFGHAKRSMKKKMNKKRR